MATALPFVPDLRQSRLPSPAPARFAPPSPLLPVYNTPNPSILNNPTPPANVFPPPSPPHLLPHFCPQPALFDRSPAPNPRFLPHHVDPPLPSPTFLPHHPLHTTPPHPLDPYPDSFLLSDPSYCSTVHLPVQPHDPHRPQPPAHHQHPPYYDAPIPPLLDLSVPNIIPALSSFDHHHHTHQDKLPTRSVQTIPARDLVSHPSLTQVTLNDPRHLLHHHTTPPRQHAHHQHAQLLPLPPPPHHPQHQHHASALPPRRDIREQQVRQAKQQQQQQQQLMSLHSSHHHASAQPASADLRLQQVAQNKQAHLLPPLPTPSQHASVQPSHPELRDQQVRQIKLQPDQRQPLLPSHPLPQQQQQRRHHQMLSLPASQLHASMQLPDTGLGSFQIRQAKQQQQQQQQNQLPPLPPPHQDASVQLPPPDLRQRHAMHGKQQSQQQQLHVQLPPLPPPQHQTLTPSHIQEGLGFPSSVPDSVMVEDSSTRHNAFLATSLAPSTVFVSDPQSLLLQYSGHSSGSVHPSVPQQASQHAFLSQGPSPQHPMQQEMFPVSEMPPPAPSGFQQQHPQPQPQQQNPLLPVQCTLSQDPGTTPVAYVAISHQQPATLLLTPPLQSQLDQGLAQSIGPPPDMSIHPLVQPSVSASNAFGVPDLLAGTQFTIRPDMVEQYMAVGRACRDIGRFDLAASTFRACMTICPESTEARTSYSSAYYRQSFYESSLEVGPVFPEDVFNDVGNSLRSLGHTNEAEAAYRAALSIAPRHAHAWNNLGNAMRAKGQVMDAMQCYTASLNSHSGFAAAHCNLAGLLRDQGKPQEAEAQYRAALMSDPNLAEAAAGLGTALRDMGRTEEAVSFYVRAVALQPDAADHHANLANTYKDLNRIEESILSYQSALTLQPDLPDAFCNMVHSLSVICDWRNREQNFATLLAIIDRQLDTLLHHPATNPRLYNTLAGALSNSTPQLVDVCGGSRSERDGASVSATTSREEDSNDRPRRKFIHHPSSPTVVKKARMRGKFAKFLTSSPSVVAPVLTSGLPSVQPFHALIYPMSPEKFRALSAAYATRAESMVTGMPLARQRWTVPKGPGARLKVGYVSSDYNNHPYSHLTQSIYGLHGTGATVECFCYALTPSDESVWRLRIQREAEHFRDISGMTAKQSAEIIASDGIHVLVNCNGYTKGARTETFALRPAPVQVSFMGFPGTLGAHYIEYFITDVVTSPPDMASRMHSEALLYHPHSYFVNDHRQTSIEGPAAYPSGPLTRAHYGLPENCFLFLMHNQLYKLSPDTFDVWARILSRVPGSKLWLLRFPPTGEQRIRDEAAARGLSPDRLIFTDVAGKDEHVARAGLGDLFLDTPTCNAHTTGTDVLWSGVPMITCPGSLFASRVAASLLTAAGVPELIAPDMLAYEDLAVELATNRAKLMAIRKKIEYSRRSNALFDTERWVRNVEALYWRAWKNYEAGNQPTHIFGTDVIDGSTMVSGPAAVESHYSVTSETLIQTHGRAYNSTVAT